MYTENVYIQTPIYLFYKDLHSNYLGCNAHLARLAGLSSEKDIIGQSDHDLIWNEKCADLYKVSDQQVLAGQAIQNRLEPLLRSDGKMTTILVNKIPMLDSRGQKIGIVGSYIEQTDFNDIGARDPMKANITLTVKQAEYLYYVAKGMSAKQIANTMEISTRTAEYYAVTLKEKFNLNSKSALIAKALTLSFIKQKLFSL